MARACQIAPAGESERANETKEDSTVMKQTATVLALAAGLALSLPAFPMDHNYPGNNCHPATGGQMGDVNRGHHMMNNNATYNREVVCPMSHQMMMNHWMYGYMWVEDKHANNFSCYMHTHDAATGSHNYGPTRTTSGTGKMMLDMGWVWMPMAAAGEMHCMVPPKSYIHNYKTVHN
jgi:hypothetical protein